MYLFDSVIDEDAANCLDPDFKDNYCPTVTTSSPQTLSTTKPQTKPPKPSPEPTPKPTITLPTISPKPTITLPTVKPTVTEPDKNVKCFILTAAQGVVNELGSWIDYKDGEKYSHSFKHLFKIPITKPTSLWYIKLSFVYPTLIKLYGKYVINSEKRQNDFIIKNKIPV